MDVNKPEVLRRGMYGENPDRPEIGEWNDVDAPFAGASAVPKDLQAIIQQPQSVDPEPEEVEKVNAELEVDAEKVAEENPQSRFQILDTAVKKPGVCALCGSAGGDGRQFVDFGKTVEFFGAVYFCTFCVVEAAKLLGLGNVQISEEFASELNRKLQGVYSENYELKERFDAAMVLLRNCHCNDLCVESAPMEIPEAELIEPENPGDDDESSDGDEQNADEPASEQGSDDVSAAPSDDEPKPVTRKRRTNSSTG